MNIKCEICNGNNIIRQDGVYVCQDCGIKYSKEDIQSLLAVSQNYEKATNQKPAQSKASMVGKYVDFGNNPGNNPRTEYLTWKVIDQTSDKLLLITKYEIYAMAHCEFPNWYSCWYNSDIRNHFLDAGINEIFNQQEQDAIILSDVKASHHPEREWTYEGKREPDSQSKLFLLSAEEVEKYFPTEDERVCGFDDGQGGYPWWLRTKGHRIDGMMVVGASGVIVDNGAPQTECIGVRPAMWMDYQKTTNILKLQFYDL